jgi:uncharacterized integral membrane protein
MSAPEPQNRPISSPAGAGSASAAATPAAAPAAPVTQTPARPAPQTGGQSPASTSDKQVAPTRTGMVWVSVCVSVLLAILLIIFLAQNTRTVAVHFLGLSGSTSLALMMLIAAVAGALITVIAGSARIIQLRRRAGRR